MISFVALGMRSEGNHPKKWRNNNWCLLHDNTPARWPVLLKDLLANNNLTTLEHTQHSPDLVRADYYLFPRLKSAGDFVTILISLRMRRNS
jgi:hypothetical protein